MEPVFYTPEEMAQMVKDNSQIHIHSKLGFLNSHNSLRRGCVHLMLGTTGGGKSTMVRTILRDFIFNKENQEASLTGSVWLSEETEKNYKMQLAYGMPSHDSLYRVVIDSELSHKGSKKEFISNQKLIRPDLLILDNITTSAFYASGSLKEQAAFAREIKDLTAELNCATLVIAHTGANVTDSMDRLIELNDIRGPKDICNLAEFAYILQRFQIDNYFYPTLRIVKHRGQELINSTYHLTYNPQLKSFERDTAIDFKKFKEIYAKRNRLK